MPADQTKLLSLTHLCARAMEILTSHDFLPLVSLSRQEDVRAPFLDVQHSFHEINEFQLGRLFHGTRSRFFSLYCVAACQSTLFSSAYHNAGKRNTPSKLSSNNSNVDVVTKYFASENERTSLFRRHRHFTTDVDARLLSPVGSLPVPSALVRLDVDLRFSLVPRLLSVRPKDRLE